MLHEPLDAKQPFAVAIAELARHRRLKVEGQALLRLTCEKMQGAASGPEEGLAAVEDCELGRRKNFRLGLAVLGRVQVDGKPMEHIEVAQAPLSVFDIRLDPVTRNTRTPQPLLALGKLCGNELTLAAMNR